MPSKKKQVIWHVGASSAQRGDIRYWDGTNWVPLPIGALGEVLVTHGVGFMPSWETLIIASSSSSSQLLSSSSSSSQLLSSSSSSSQLLSSSSSSSQLLSSSSSSSQLLSSSSSSGFTKW